MGTVTTKTSYNSVSNLNLEGEDAGLLEIHEIIHGTLAIHIHNQSLRKIASIWMTSKNS